MNLRDLCQGCLRCCTWRGWESNLEPCVYILVCSSSTPIWSWIFKWCNLLVITWLKNSSCQNIGVVSILAACPILQSQSHLYSVPHLLFAESTAYRQIEQGQIASPPQTGNHRAPVSTLCIQTTPLRHSEPSLIGGTLMNILGSQVSSQEHWHLFLRNYTVYIFYFWSTLWRKGFRAPANLSSHPPPLVPVLVC